MKRLFLTVVMLLMGMALVGGAAASLVGGALIPLDQQVGTHTSAAGAVLGIGIMAWTWVIIRRWTRKDTPYTAPARIAPARIARAAWTAEFGMGDKATASSPTTAATARAIGVITGSC